MGFHKFDDPIGFNPVRIEDGIEVEYFNLLEVTQGGPTTGNLKINGRVVSESHRFGGPLLIYKEYIYLTIFTKKLLSTGFKLCRIHNQSLDIEIIGHMRGVIFLDKIQSDQIHFYEDLDKTVSNHCDIAEFGES